MEITLGHDNEPAHAQVSIELDPSNAELCAKELEALAVKEYFNELDEVLK